MMGSTNVALELRKARADDWQCGLSVISMTSGVRSC